MRRIIRLVILYGYIAWLPIIQPVLAAPYFYITGAKTVNYLETQTYSVFLDTDSQTVTALQAVVNIDKAIFATGVVGNTQSKCNLWVYPDPSLGFGSLSTPAFYQDDKVVIACGFSEGGYRSTTATGDLIATFSVTSQLPLSQSTQFTFTNVQFRYIGTTINPGASAAFTLNTHSASISATPTPVPTSVLKQDVLTLGQMKFKEISVRQTTPRPTSSLTTLNEPETLAMQPVALDDSIPNPPAMTPRPTQAPYVLPTAVPTQAKKDKGDVLSIQSLKELFIPGKSDADQTIVLINLISFLSFLTIATILVWRLIVITRINNIKRRHMKEILASELFVLETKLAGTSDNKQLINDELEALRKKLESI